MVVTTRIVQNTRPMPLHIANPPSLQGTVNVNWMPNIRIEGDYLSQRRVSLYIREDYIRQSMLNTITKTLLRFMPEGMMEERIVKYGIKI